MGDTLSSHRWDGARTSCSSGPQVIKNVQPLKCSHLSANIPAVHKCTFPRTSGPHQLYWPPESLGTLWNIGIFHPCLHAFLASMFSSHVKYKGCFCCAAQADRCRLFSAPSMRSMSGWPPLSSNSRGAAESGWVTRPRRSRRKYLLAGCTTMATINMVLQLEPRNFHRFFLFSSCVT